MAVTLQPVGKDIDVDHTAIVTRSNDISTKLEIVITKGIHLHPVAISRRKVLKDIGDSIQDCCGILPHLGAGMNTLSFTILHHYNRDAALSSLALEKKKITNNKKVYDLSPHRCRASRSASSCH